MNQPKDISTIPVDGYIPDSFNWKNIQNLMDICNLGKKKIKELINWWLAEVSKIKNDLNSFQEKYAGRPQYWESWQGDARHGNDLACCGLNRYAKRTHATFLTEKLPADKKSEYEKLLKKLIKANIVIGNLNMLCNNIRKP